MKGKEKRRRENLSVCGKKEGELYFVFFGF